MKKKIAGISLVLLLLVVTGILWMQFTDKKEQQMGSVEQLESTKKLHLRILTGMVYRHLIGYKMVCKEEGVDLHKYPDYFASKYHEEIQKIDTVWQKDGTNLQEVLVHFDPKLFSKISIDIKKELIDIERIAAKYILSHQQNVSVEDVKWTKEHESKLNLKDACFLLDEEAPLFLNNSAFDKEFNDRIKDLK